MDKSEDTDLILSTVVNKIEENCLLIATGWVKENNVKSIFSHYKISVKKFRDSYSVPIINYFISVIKKEKKAGNCPIMSKFVQYMLKQEITPQEVFTICMGFRKSLIRFLLQDDIVLKDPLAFMEEVATLFDANLSGVLDIFTTSYAQTHKKAAIAKAQKDQLQQTLKIINSINTKIVIVEDGNITLVNKPFLEMTGVDNLKHFHEKFQNDFDFFHDVDVYENDYKKDVSAWVEKISENRKHFKTNIYHTLAGATLSYTGRITKMPIDGTDQYIIALSNISGHIKDEKMLQDSLSHDEVTGFRNYSAFASFLTQMIEDAKEKDTKLFLAVVDIIDLKEINDTLGREAGDRIISEIAEDLRYLVDENIYLSRLEGSRFGILIKENSEQNVYDWSIKLHKKIKEHKCTQRISATEVDMSQSTSKLFLRAYSLLEQENDEHTVIKNDFENIVEYKDLEDQDVFTKNLAKLKFIDTSLYFMELPITSKVKITSTKQEDATFVLSPKQIKIAKPGMQIYFKLGILGSIKATIQDVNQDTYIATIHEFRKDTHTPLNRKTYRVQASSSIKAYLTHNNEDHTVKILDLNDKFIAIEVDRKRNLDINSLVHIDISFPEDKTSSFCKTNATVTRINKVPKGYKIVLLCHLDENNDRILSQYISKQQIDIINTMKA